MDGKIEDNWISKYKDKYIPYEISCGDDAGSFFETAKYIKSKNIEDNDLIYFLENDYLHTPDWVEKVTALFTEFKGLTYVSLYDHNDKYFLPMYNDLTSKIWVTSNHHWRLTPSTCGSFITTKKILTEDFEDQTGVTTPIGDHHKWLYLTQAKNRFIITQIPGLSTHCMVNLLSPTINWKQINAKCNNPNI
jgi:hypothetical protein